jgi:hypothetical protein
LLNPAAQQGFGDLVNAAIAHGIISTPNRLTLGIAALSDLDIIGLAQCRQEKVQEALGQRTQTAQPRGCMAWYQVWALKFGSVKGSFHDVLCRSCLRTLSSD